MAGGTSATAASCRFPADVRLEPAAPTADGLPRGQSHERLLSVATIAQRIHELRQLRFPGPGSYGPTIRRPAAAATEK